MSWSVRPVEAHDHARLRQLFGDRADRLAALDARLRLPRAPTSVSTALVAVDEDGRIGAYLQPQLVELAPDDEMRSFAADRAVAWRDVAADDTDALAALVAAVRRPAAADVTLWPAADREAAAFFALFGLEPVFAYAFRPPGPLPPGRTALVRPVRPADAAAVAALHVEEVAFHEPHTRCVRLVPGLEAAFRRRLEGVWAGAPDASLVHVLEVDGTVAGMCESMVQVVPDDGGGQLRPGRYGYLNSVGIGAPWRGQGFGRALVSAVLEDLADRQLDGYTLWFAVDNPLASRVWPRLGFHPLWLSYERRDAPPLLP